MKPFILILILVTIGCKAHNIVSQGNSKIQQDYRPQLIPGPKALVYKTRVNYNNLVPVIMSDDKSEIVSYPHPTDIKNGEKFQTPTLLHNGFLLDNRGIGLNVAFLKLTYEEYSKLKNPPPLKDLYKLISDKDPLLEMYDCGYKNSDLNLVNHLNNLIDNAELSTDCRKLK
jgi:hypothetical protein